MKQEQIEELLKGTRYTEPNNCTCLARHEGECACEDANWFTWQEREMAARVQLLAKALHSIAGNTCCDGCQEAKKVAQTALAEAGLDKEIT